MHLSLWIDLRKPQLLYCWQEECSFTGRVICKRRDQPRSLQERMGSSSPERRGQRILGLKCWKKGETPQMQRRQPCSP